METYWVTSRSLEYDLRLEAGSLAEAADLVGRMIDKNVVSGLVNQDLGRVVIVNWRAVTDVAVWAERPESFKDAAGFPEGVGAEVELAILADALEDDMLSGNE